MNILHGRAISVIWEGLVILGFATRASVAQPPLPPAGFHCEPATFTLGQDGKLYFANLAKQGEQGSYVLRIEQDGSKPTGSHVEHAIFNATANAQGVMATVHGHFIRKLAIYDANFNVVGSVGSFSFADGFSAPAHVEAAPSGDFYVLDQYADRIVRFRPDGIRNKTFLVPREPARPQGEMRDFRICEKTKRLYVLADEPAANIRCLSVAGDAWKIRCQELWRVPTLVAWAEPQFGGGTGAFDVDAEGFLYVSDGRSDHLRQFDSNGQELPKIPLQLAELQPTPAERGFHSLRVHDGHVFLKRMHPSELCQQYDLATGKRIAVLATDRMGAIQPPESTAFAALASPRHSNTTPMLRRVLFVGNSQISCVRDIPEIVEDLSHSAPAEDPRVEADSVVIGGAPLEALWKDGRAKAKIETGDYDWVVIQEMIGFPESQRDLMFDYVRRFASIIEKSGARMLLFAVPQVEGKKPAHTVIHDVTLQCAHDHKCRVAGGGAAWLKAWSAQPTLDLHFTDRAHPNGQGCYLNACVIFSALTDANSVGLDPCDLTPEQAGFLQRIAWDQYTEDRLREKAQPTAN